MQHNTNDAFLHYHGRIAQFRSVPNPEVRGALGNDAARVSDDDPGGFGGRNLTWVNEDVHPTHPQTQQSGSGQFHNGQQDADANLVGEHANGGNAQLVGGGGADPEGNPTHSRSHTKKSRAALRIASLNINGGGTPRSNMKWAAIRDTLKSESINILALQETHLTAEDLTDLEQRFNRFKVLGTPHPTHPTNRGGVAVVINKHNTKWEGATGQEIIPGRALIAKIKLNDMSDLILLAVYAPSGNDTANADFWATLSTRLTELEYNHIDIMLGDLNMVESRADRFPPRPDTEFVVDALQNMKTTWDLRDGWRVINPDKGEHTFRTKRRTGQANSRSRIDRIYVRDALIDQCDEWKIAESGIKTDHSLVSVYLSPKTLPYVGPGRSTVPDFILEYPEVRRDILAKAKIAAAKICTSALPQNRTAENNPQKAWKSLKENIMDISKSFARSRSTHLDRQLKLWTQRRDEALSRRDSDPTNEDIQALLDEIEDNIESLTIARRTRSRNTMLANIHLKMDGGTAYDYKLRREKKPRDTVSSLRIPFSNPPRYTTNSKTMVNIMTNHHDKLQTQFGYDPMSDHVQRAQGEVLASLTPRLSANETADLDAPFTKEEVTCALMKIPNGKASGLDGIPIEVWKYIARHHDEAERSGNQDEKDKAVDISLTLTTLFNDIRQYGVTKDTQFAEGWMCPIYKKKDRTDVNNYRPITVLNTDYKTMTRVLTDRISEVAPNLIHPDQAGFIKGRSIYDQVELARTVIDTCEEEKMNGAIICLDQEKAYDRITHDFLWKTLETFGFPQSFIETIKNLYSDAETTVILNGVKGKKFRIVRSVRQGDPLSCLLFDLCIESLASMLRQSGLKGLQYENLIKRILLSLFADDVNVFLHELDNIITLFKKLGVYGTASGAKFNIEKTLVIPLGNEEYRDRLRLSRKLNPTSGEIPPGIRIAQEGEAVRILGAYVGYGTNEEEIWAPVLEKTRATLKRWDRANPTIRGRKIAVNALVGGYSQYLMRVQGMPKTVLKKLKGTIDDFIYAKHGATSSNAIGISTLYLENNEGGIGLMDIESRNDAIEIVRARSYNLPPDQRPIWCYLADRALSRAAILKYRTMVGATFLLNPFTQTWRVNLNAEGLPASIKRMMKAAYKFNVQGIGIRLTENAKREMPYWFHIGTKEPKTSIYGDKWGKCQRATHGIKLTGEMWRHARKIYAHTCDDNDDCECQNCCEDRLLGCENPRKCRRNAWKKLQNLEDEWLPSQNPADEIPEPRNDDIPGYTKVNTPINTSEYPTDTVRAFAPPNSPRTAANLGPLAIDPNGMAIERDEVRVWTDGSCHNNGLANAASGSGLWYGEEDERNRALRTPITLPQSNNVGEMAAVLTAIQSHQGDTNILISSDSTYTINATTTLLKGWFSDAFVNSKNLPLIRALAGELMNSSANIYIRKVKAHSGDRGNDGADALANEGSLKPVPDPIALQAGLAIEAVGAELRGLTQAQAYKLVRRQRKKNKRRRTETTVERILATVEAITGVAYTPQSLWESVRKRPQVATTQKFAAWGWKTLHSGYKIGTYWNQILPDRAICMSCPERPVEDMEHILCHCNSSGQDVIWSLARNLWNKTTLPWPDHTNIGQILGINLIEIRNRQGQIMKGRTRLFRIIVSESAYLAWVLRCEWRIGREANPTKHHTKDEITTRWNATIARRARIDQNLTNKRAYGKQALQKSLVHNTWLGLSEDSEGEHYEGVLVGNHANRRPPGRNR